MTSSTAVRRREQAQRAQNQSNGSRNARYPGRRAAGRNARRSAGRNTAWYIFGAVVAVVALAAVIAVATSGDASNSSTAVAQTWPVQVTGSALAPLGSDSVDPAIGAIAPELSGQSFDGSSVSYQHGKPTLLLFLAHWCPHCQAEVPVLVDWAKAGRAPAGLSVLGIATGTDSSRPNYPPSSWLEREAFPWPVLADNATSDAGTAMGLTSFPYFVLVGADGTVLARASGELDTAALDALVAPAVADR